MRETTARQRLGGLIAVASLVAAAGCGTATTSSPGTSDSGFKNDTGLLTALSHVRSTKATRQYVAYGHVAALRQVAGGGAAGSRYSSLQGHGYSHLAARSQMLSKRTGIDPRTAQRAVAVGKPPQQAGRLQGEFRTEKINKQLGTLTGSPKRSDQGGGTRWVWSDQGGLGRDVPFPYLMVLNVIQVSSESISYGTGTEAVSWVTQPGNETLADTQPHRAVGNCLGDVVSATLAAPEGGGQAELIGMGVRTASNGQPVEVLCVAAASKDRAQRIADAAVQQLKQGTTANHQPWSNLLSKPKATVVGGESHIVRITARPTDGEKAGIFFSTFTKGQLQRLLHT